MNRGERRAAARASVQRARAPHVTMKVDRKSTPYPVRPEPTEIKEFDSSKR